jgi:hypothetical protein
VVTIATRIGRFASLAAVLVLLTGCALVSKKATTMVADTLTAGGSTFQTDDDPELVRDAVPFGLKTYESLLETLPKHVPLLTATCSGFTSYAYGFIATDADQIRARDRASAKAMDERALKMYLRAHGYCMRALEVRFKGVGAKLLTDPDHALDKARKEDVELLYWSAASWGLAMSLDPDKLAIDYPAVRAMANRALALDRTWWKGASHELMIALDSQEILGGSIENARRHFDRAIELQNGDLPGPYIALAMGVAVPKQDRAEFEKLMNSALSLDPEKDKSSRLLTILLQRRARALLDSADTLFLK